MYNWIKKILSFLNNSIKKILGFFFIILIGILLESSFSPFDIFGESEEDTSQKISITFKRSLGLGELAEIRLLDINIGYVDSVMLSPDLQSVTVVAYIYQDMSSLLRSDTKFWIVTPKISLSGVSGLDTIIGGPHLEILPGNSEATSQEFVGLDGPPVIPIINPGLEITLISNKVDSVKVGNPVLHRGFQVGYVENIEFDIERKKFLTKVFIQSPNDSIITSNTHFWNSSGISIDATVTGVSLQSESLESLLSGGIAFDLPSGFEPGKTIDENTEFELYPSLNSIYETSYENYIDYLLLFESSIYGLAEGSPVLYKGFRVGTVVDFSFEYLNESKFDSFDGNTGIPVLIRLEPGRWAGKDTAELKELTLENIEQNVKDGLRASLILDNLLTGALLVNIDFYDNAEDKEIYTAGEYLVLPTISTNIESIQVKITKLVDNLNELPIDDLLKGADETVLELSKTLATVNKVTSHLETILEKENSQELIEEIGSAVDDLRAVLKGLSPDSNLYNNLNSSIEQLNQTLLNIEKLTYNIDSNPSSLIFSKPKPNDIQPRAINEK